jgi:hypothetical protein
MTELTLHLDDAIVAQLRTRAQREGIEVDVLVEREVVRIAVSDPFAFFGSGESDQLRGATLRQHLVDEEFGTR